jgi:ferric-dicitrate binding protein FerR (iron transport regulator)
MSERDVHESTASIHAVREAVRSRAHPKPEPAFRARLREEFRSGRFAPPQRLRPTPWFRRAPALLPLAAGALLALGLYANRGPDWQVIGVHGDGRVHAGGRSFGAADAGSLTALLRRGGPIRIEGALTLDLAAAGVAAVSLGPDSDARLSGTPGRWWRRAMRATVSSGDVYFTTGRAFRGATLDVTTPEVSVRAVGTSFAVLRHASGSCVCVMSGRVRVAALGAAAGEMVEVPEGMRRVVGVDGAGETLRILDDSVHRLHEQRAAALRWLER